MDKDKERDIFEAGELTEDILSEKEPNVMDKEALISMNSSKIKQMSKLIQSKASKQSEESKNQGVEYEEFLQGRPYIWGLELNIDSSPTKYSKNIVSKPPKPVFIKKCMQNITKMESVGNKLFLLEKS